jgi:hypothetical protein
VTAIRWWLFKRLSALGWWICPPPHKENLKAIWVIGIDQVDGEKRER